MTTKTVSFESLKAFRPKIVEVTVEELGETFRIRQWSTKEFIEFHSRGDVVSRGEELSKGIVDDDGALIFDSPEGVEILDGLPIKISAELVEAQRALNGLGDKKETENEKKSETSPGESSALS